MAANIRKMFFYFNASISSEKGIKEVVVSWDIIRKTIHGMAWSKIREYFVSQSLKRHCCRWIIQDIPKDVADKFLGAEVFSNDYFEFNESATPETVPEMEQGLLELPEEVVPEIA